MSNEQIIKCVFCQGLGNNPHFRGTCPVCKGKGKNNVIGKYMTCGSCRGSGQKGGTTLTCYDCGGLGVIPDTRETFIRAREEIKEAQEEIVRERSARHRLSPQATAGGAGLTEKGVINTTQKRKDEEGKWGEEKGEEESGGKTHFCQCCGNEVNDSVTIKICLDCFRKVKELRAYKE